MYEQLQERKSTSKQSIKQKDSIQLKRSVDNKSSKTRKPNNTGIPTQMKAKFEGISGYSFDDVKVHYNSDKPAQLQALAYTQGNQVHIASGQEKHLSHELGHIIQQKQGIVKPTTMIGGVPVNDNPALEHLADSLQQRTLDTHTQTQSYGSKSVYQLIKEPNKPLGGEQSPSQRLNEEKESLQNDIFLLVCEMGEDLEDQNSKLSQKRDRCTQIDKALELWEESCGENNKNNTLSISCDKNTLSKETLTSEKITAETLKDLLGNYQYVSKSGDKVGSIYFQNGRIRLLHSSGPAIEVKQRTNRFMIKNDVTRDAFEKSKNKEELYERISSNPQVQLPTGSRLFEEHFCNKEIVGKETSHHLSRGGASNMNFTNEVIMNILREVIKILTYPPVRNESILSENRIKAANEQLKTNLAPQAMPNGFDM